jgi:hypothetical protein
MQCGIGPLHAIVWWWLFQAAFPMLFTAMHASHRPGALHTTRNCIVLILLLDQKTKRLFSAHIASAGVAMVNNQGDLKTDFRYPMGQDKTDGFDLSGQMQANEIADARFERFCVNLQT